MEAVGVCDILGGARPPCEQRADVFLPDRESGGAPAVPFFLAQDVNRSREEIPEGEHLFP